MTYDELMEEYSIADICPEIDNDLNGFFIDICGENFEMGIFPEPDSDNENNFVVTVEINSEEADLSKEDTSSIKKMVEQELWKNLHNDAETVKKYFAGVQIFLNDDLVE